MDKPDLTELTAISPIDGRYRKLTKELAGIFSEHGLQSWRKYVEIAWLEHLIDIYEIEVSDGHEITIERMALPSLDDTINIKAWEKKTNHDVKAVEYHICEKLSELGLDHLHNMVHFGLTSEDTTNIAIAFMAKKGRNIILDHLRQLIKDLGKLALKWKTVPMLSHTHGQAASPTTVGKEIVNLAASLQEEYRNLGRIKIKAKLNGATGNYSALQFADDSKDWILDGQEFIKQFNFTPNLFTAQTNDYGYLSEICHSLARVSARLMKIDRDMWSYISRFYFKLRVEENEVGSSTMPHKVNPIDFENSESNAETAIPILEKAGTKLLITRMQRDLTDSSFLRNLGSAFGYVLIALKSCRKGLGKIEINETALQQDLKDQYALLAEPVQSLMRLRGVTNPYDQLKRVTRGKEISRDDLLRLVKSCPELNDEDIHKFDNLLPKDYIGLVEELVEIYFTLYRHP